MMSKDLCIDCNKETLINRIPTELFNENGDVIDDNVYRCEDCENKLREEDNES
jgi:DNA-directed RNA polymerase subunit RPC12/RpoP